MHSAFLLLFVLTFLCEKTPSLTNQNQGVLSALHRQVSSLENENTSKHQFEAHCPRQSIPIWISLQKRVHPYSTASSDLCFALAYYDVNYVNNVNCLYSIWPKPPEAVTGGNLAQAACSSSMGRRLVRSKSNHP